VKCTIASKAPGRMGSYFALNTKMAPEKSPEKTREKEMLVAEKEASELVCYKCQSVCRRTGRACMCERRRECVFLLVCIYLIQLLCVYICGWKGVDLGDGMDVCWRERMGERGRERER